MTSKYGLSNLGPTSKVKIRGKVYKFLIQIIKVISNCVKWDAPLPYAAIELTETLTNKYASKSIVKFPNLLKFDMYYSCQL